ncbi:MULTISPECIES: hypothetical protein [unclassified Bartonella]|uniref:hypothetical protein n=2 Tax=Bartonella TaxID=773 RepID=UPI0035CFD782
MEKKYELTDEKTEVNDKTLRRIRALRDLGDVKKGDLGGFIENEDNLSHDGNCWVGDDAKVYGYAKVFGDAYIDNIADIYENACVFANAQIYENAQVSGGAFINGNAKIYDSPLISIRAKVGGNAKIYGYAFIHGNAEIINDEIITTGERQ